MIHDLSKNDLSPEDRLLPAERHTVILGGKAYFWSRETAWGDLELVPGYAPRDPAGCQAKQVQQLATGAPSWPRVCRLHRAHGTRHLHQPVLGDPGEWWGESPVRLPNGAIAVPTLDGSINVTYDDPMHQEMALRSGDPLGEQYR